MSERRFLVDPSDIDPAAGEALVRGPEHHHLARVLRLRPGDVVSIFDGEGNGHHAVIEAVDRSSARLRITGQDRRRVEPRFSLTLAQAIPHSDKMEWIIQKATELGVARVVPLASERGVLKPRKEGWPRLDRWRRVAQEAARQCGRLSVPAIAEPRSWESFLDSEPTRPSRSRLLLAEGDPGSGLTRLSLPHGASEAAVAVGPEGGWSPAERAAASDHGWDSISLGPRVLRAETAGVAAVALILFLAGEMGPAT